MSQPLLIPGDKPGPMSQRAACRKISTAAGGFTLVELLVVISIIVLLLGLMLPALGRSRSAAFMTICKSNLRQMFIASYAYSNDFKNYLPDRDTLGRSYFRRAPGTRGDTDTMDEIYGLAATLDKGQYMDGNTKVWVCPGQPLTWMKELGNTYAFGTGTTFAKNRIDELGQTVWVFDNYLGAPPAAGVIANAGLIPAAQRLPPHEFGNIANQKDGCNYLYTDGYIVLDAAKP